MEFVQQKFLPLVSVVIATYNGEKYLSKQLDSVYSQTYQNIEVLVSDDCSRDNTVGILSEYSNKHGLRYSVNDSNLGFVKNFEKLLSCCTGDYIALTDQDDIWLPEKIEILVREIGDYSLIYSDAFLIDEHDISLPGSLVRKSGVRPVSGKEFAYFVCNSCVTGCTVLFRRELLNVALPIPACETYHDWWLAVAASRLNGVVYLNDRLTKYRQHGENDTGATVKTGILSRIAAQFCVETQESKKRYFELMRNRADEYRMMGERLQLTSMERSYLEDIKSYAEALLSGTNRLTALKLAFKHKDTLFPSACGAEKFIFVFSKLFAARVR